MIMEKEIKTHYYLISKEVIIEKTKTLDFDLIIFKINKSDSYIGAFNGDYSITKQGNLIVQSNAKSKFLESLNYYFRNKSDLEFIINTVNNYVK